MATEEGAQKNVDELEGRAYETLEREFQEVCLRLIYLSLATSYYATIRGSGVQATQHFHPYRKARLTNAESRQIQFETYQYSFQLL